jgi:ABC-2 type transport system permease protein
MKLKTTFIQKLLGRQYKWWFLYLHTFKSNTTYRLSLVGYFAANLIYLASSLLIWSVAQNPDFNFSYIFTYFVIGQVFMIEGELFYDIAGYISNGQLSSKLLMPSNIFIRFIIHDLGFLTYTKLIIQPIIYLVLALIMSQFILLPTLINFIFFIILSILSYIIYIFYSILLGSIAFLIPNIWGIIDLSRTIKDFTSGKYFPLNIIWFTKILYFTPFAFTFYHPMQVYLGKYDLNQTFLVLLGGLAWCFIMYILAKTAFKLGLKRNEAVGL